MCKTSNKYSRTNGYDPIESDIYVPTICVNTYTAKSTTEVTKKGLYFLNNVRIYVTINAHCKVAKRKLITKKPATSNSVFSNGVSSNGLILHTAAVRIKK